jgi:hypothetical protein
MSLYKTILTGTNCDLRDRDPVSYYTALAPDFESGPLDRYPAPKPTLKRI